MASAMQNTNVPNRTEGDDEKGMAPDLWIRQENRRDHRMLGKKDGHPQNTQYLYFVKLSGDFDNKIYLPYNEDSKGTFYPDCVYSCITVANSLTNSLGDDSSPYCNS
uniref:Uncharacterized protein n=1 Tax=Romanomermis culicivorax TaxID=13658 RepID=A0A915I2T0_ROMCU